MGGASRSSFYGFEIAKTGLFISQHNMNVTGHNISNANTKGYTRQRLVTSALEPLSGIGKLATYEKGLVGGGTTSHYVEQLRSAFLDSEYRTQNSKNGTWSERLDALEFAETVFDEPNEVGVIKHIQQFRSALADLSKTSTGQAERAAFISAAKTLTSTFNQYYNQLTNQQNDLNSEIKTKVDGQVNSLAERIGALNEKIYNFEMSGEHANDLRDQRNVLIDELSSLVQVDVREYKEGEGTPARLSISIGKDKSKGNLVDHTTVNKLALKAVNNSIQEDTTNAPNVVGQATSTVWAVMWADGYQPPPPAAGPTDNREADFTANYTNTTDPHPTAEQMKKMYDLLGEGEIKGTLTMRDGNDTKNVGIPYLVEQLNTLARSIVKEFNTIHNQGWSQPHNSNGNKSETGLDFFKDFGDPDDGLTNNYDLVTAGNFQLDNKMTKDTDVWNIACSDQKITDTTEGNNVNMVQKLLGVVDGKNHANVGNFTEYYNAFLVEIANQTSYCKTEYQTADTLKTSADNARLSLSQVSIDEEMTNMVKFNHAFNASSRMINTIDEMLDKVINGMGMVGR